MVFFSFSERNLNPKAACLKRREEEKTEELPGGRGMTSDDLAAQQAALSGKVRNMLLPYSGGQYNQDDGDLDDFCWHRVNRPLPFSICLSLTSGWTIPSSIFLFLVPQPRMLNVSLHLSLFPWLNFCPDVTKLTWLFCRIKVMIVTLFYNWN